MSIRLLNRDGGCNMPYDNNEPIISTKDTIIEWLKSAVKLKNVDVIAEYPSVDAKLPLKRPLISIGDPRPNYKSTGLNNYLGEEIDEDTGTEHIGVFLNITFDLYIWNNTAPKFGGTREIERIEGALVRLFSLTGPPKGITVKNYLPDQIQEDPEEAVYMCPGSLQVQVLVTGTVIYDLIKEIEVRGEIIHE
jgi:hypothetical protein